MGLHIFYTIFICIEYIAIHQPVVQVCLSPPLVLFVQLPPVTDHFNTEAKENHFPLFQYNKASIEMNNHIHSYTPMTRVKYSVRSNTFSALFSV